MHTCPFSSHRLAQPRRTFLGRNDLFNLKNFAMIVKKFKKGNWVKTRGNPKANKIEVIKYISKKRPLEDSINNNG